MYVSNAIINLMCIKHTICFSTKKSETVSLKRAEAILLPLRPDPTFEIKNVDKVNLGILCVQMC